MSPAKSSPKTAKRATRRSKSAAAKAVDDDSLILDDGPGWQRALYMIGFAFVAYFMLWLVFVLAVVQAVLSRFNARPNPHLLRFVRNLNGYFGDILGFLGFVSNKVPFPFSSFPDLDGE